MLKRVADRARLLDRLGDLPRSTAYQQLTELRGIGPWTAGKTLAFALGDPDALPLGDYHIPNDVAWALAREPRADDARMIELLEPYRGQRGRVLELIKAGRIAAPRRGPRFGSSSRSG